MQKEQALEQFGVVNPQTGEVEIDRVALKKSFVERGVYISKEIEFLKRDLKAVVTEAVDDHDFDKTNLNALIKHSHKNAIDEEMFKLERLRGEIEKMFESVEYDDE